MPDTSASGSTLFEYGDQLNEPNLGDWIGRQNATNYVEDGLGISYDDANTEATVGTGKAVVRDESNVRDYTVTVESSVTVSLTSSAVNHLFVATSVDATSDTVDDEQYLHVDTDDTPPSDPSVKIGTVDTSDGSVSELNRNPDATFGSLESDVFDAPSGGPVEVLNTDLELNGNNIVNAMGIGHKDGHFTVRTHGYGANVWDSTNEQYLVQWNEGGPVEVGTELQASSISTESVVNDYYFAGAFDGSDADTRLDNALSAASEGDVISLESAEYTANRTISTPLTLQGTSVRFGYGSHISGDWTIEGNETVIERVVLANGSITVNANSVFLTRINKGDVTFGSDSADGIIDASSQVSVTDNGSNTVGDIA